MSIYKRFFVFLLFLLGIVILSGCTKSPAEKIYETLEDVVAEEQDFEEQQEPLVELVNKEKELYDQILALGMKEFDKIVELSKEASSLADQRKELMHKEEESIQASKKTFQSIHPLIEKLEDGEAKKLAEELYETMMNRYEHYEDLYDNYINGIELDKELYAMLQKEDLSYEELEKQIEKMNEAYEKVDQANEKFNEETKKYNEIKPEFYEAAGLDIEESK